MYVIYWSEGRKAYQHRCGDLPRTQRFINTLLKSNVENIVTVNTEKNKASLTQR